MSLKETMLATHCKEECDNLKPDAQLKKGGTN